MADPERPLGPPVDVTPAPHPTHVILKGSSVDVRPIEPERHARDLFPAIGGAEHDDLWTYMFDGPFPDEMSLRLYLTHRASLEDPMSYVITDAGSGRAVGLLSLMRIDQKNRVIEVGSIMFAPAIQRTRAATEAIYLLARYVFEDLGYRRFEWKCNALHAGSRRAALRFGFRFEGIFRQHMIIKGRSRDTAWYAIVDADWPAVRAEFQRWLAEANFDAEGKERTKLRTSHP